MHNFGSRPLDTSLYSLHSIWRWIHHHILSYSYDDLNKLLELASKLISSSSSSFSFWSFASSPPASAPRIPPLSRAMTTTRSTTTPSPWAGRTRNSRGSTSRERTSPSTSSPSSSAESSSHSWPLELVSTQRKKIADKKPTLG
jgi:hypothetical protein